MCTCFLKPRPRPRLTGSLTGVSCTNERTAPILAQSPHPNQAPKHEIKLHNFCCCWTKPKSNKIKQHLETQKQLLHSWVLHEGSETMQLQTWIVPGGIEHAAARSQAIVRCQHHQTILLTLNFKRGEAGLLLTTRFQFWGKLLVNKKYIKIWPNDV